MDNFFQVIFILFIIFSFLAPLFKKKPEEQQRKRQQQPDDNSNTSGTVTSYPSSTKADSEDFDILREIEGMFNKPAETEPVEEPTVNEAAYEENYKEAEWHEPSKSEASLDEEWHRPTTDADFAKEKEYMDEKAKEFEKFLNEKKKVNIIARDIKKTIKNSETLKEYFVISEIIGKPKAFETN